MKTKSIFSCLALAVLLFSCKKEAPADNSNTTSFEFTVNNSEYKWSFQPDGANLEKGARLIRVTSPNTNQWAYVLEGWSTPEGISVQCMFNTSALTLGTLTTTTTSSDPYVNSIFELDGVEYVSDWGDDCTINITKISGKYVSGYFSAVMHDRLSSNTEIRLYKGYFNNILVR